MKDDEVGKPSGPLGLEPTGLWSRVPKTMERTHMNLLSPRKVVSHSSYLSALDFLHYMVELDVFPSLKCLKVS